MDIGRVFYCPLEASWQTGPATPMGVEAQPGVFVFYLHMLASFLVRVPLLFIAVNYSSISSDVWDTHHFRYRMVYVDPDKHAMCIQFVLLYPMANSS